MSGRFGMQLRRYGRYFATLMALVILGSAAGFYILLQQRLPNPFQTFYAGRRPVSHRGCRGAGPGRAGQRRRRARRRDHRNLASGRAGRGPHGDRPSQDAAAVPRRPADLVPNTPLKDMQVNIVPGHASAGMLAHGGTIPISQTTSPIDSDELLSALDADTRAVVHQPDHRARHTAPAAAGGDIRRLLRTLGPTSVQLRQIGDLLASRRQALATAGSQPRGAQPGHQRQGLAAGHRCAGG